MLKWLWAWHIKEQGRRRMEKLAQWVAWHLPRSLAMWCAVRVGSHATVGEYGSTVVSELTFMDALERWSK